MVALLLQVLETQVRFPPLTQLGQLAMSCNPATGGQEQGMVRGMLGLLSPWPNSHTLGFFKLDAGKTVVPPPSKLLGGKIYGVWAQILERTKSFQLNVDLSVYDV